MEGGGAKGAYEFGVLEAFSEHGIQFDVVAGTSVGGLNAALWSMDRLDFGRELWTNLSADRVYPSRFSRITSLFFVPIVVILHLTLGYVTTSLPREMDGAIQRIIRPIWSALWIGLAVYGGVRQNFTLAGIACAIAFASAFSHKHFVRAKIQELAIWLAIPVTFLFSIVVTSGLPEKYFPWPLGLLVPFAMTLFILGFFVYVGYLFYTFACLDSSPLRGEIEQLLEESALNMPTFITVAQLVPLADPDDCIALRKTPFTHRKYMDDPGAPIPELAHAPSVGVPRYIAAHELDNTNLADALLASAALPFGIVPPVEIDDKDYVDGGVADNLPIFPVADCDELVVVRCNPDLDPQEAIDAREKDRWRKIQRVLDLVEFSGGSGSFFLEEAGSIKNDPPIRCPYREPSRFPKLRVLAPSSDLGSFLRGTMNFRKEYARTLVKQGYEDATEYLKRNSDLHSTDSSIAIPAS